jgi:chromosome segregation ATPase
MNSKRLPAEVLAEARRRDSHLKRTKVLAVVDGMAARGEPVTFAAVAKAAGVSNWLVYAEGVREHIQSIRDKQDAQDQRWLSSSTSGTAALKTDLELSRQEISWLRTERDKLKSALQRQLGQQLDHVAAGDVIARIDELTQQNERLVAERDALERERAELEAKLAETEEDLGAARTSLRRMIRSESSAPNVE